MNLIYDNTTKIVSWYTVDAIEQANGVYTIGGISIGASVDSNTLVNDVIECPYQFFPYVLSYDNGSWAISDRAEYDINITLQKQVLSKPILAERDGLLQASDWTQIPNNPLTTAQQQAWATYRQQLRDITAQLNYPYSVTWPTAPTLPKSNQPESSGLQSA